MYDMNSSGFSALDAAANGLEVADGMPGQAAVGLQVFGPHPLLSDVVEDIWDWDCPDAMVARSMTLKLPPSSYAFLIWQYRMPLAADWRFSVVRQAHALRRHLVKMRTGLVTVRPLGPIGTVIARIRPEAAGRVTRSPLPMVIDQKIDLRHIFGRRASLRLATALAAAPDAVSRVTLLQERLLEQLHPGRPAGLLAQAAASLRFNPSLSVRDLAARLDISERHLSRGFKAAFGTGPKQFARLVRVEKAVAARREGIGWSDIAQACGFADQAHLIHDFRAIIGVAPEEIFRPPQLQDAPQGTQRIRPFFNLFVG